MTRKEKKAHKRWADESMKILRRNMQRGDTVPRMRPRWRSYRHLPVVITIASGWAQLVCDTPGYNLRIKL